MLTELCHLLSLSAALVAQSAPLPIPARGISSRSLAESLLTKRKTPSLACEPHRSEHTHEPLADFKEQVEELVARTGGLGDSKLLSKGIEAIDVNLSEEVAGTMAGTSSSVPQAPDGAFTAIRRKPYMDQLLNQTHGGDRRESLLRKKLAELEKLLPQRVPKNANKTAIAGAVELTSEAEAQGDYLTWGEVQKLKNVITRLKYRQRRQKKRSVSKLPSFSTSSSSAESSRDSETSSSSSETSDSEPAAPFADSEVPEWSVKQLRSPLVRTPRVQRGSSTAIVSGSSARDPDTPTSSASKHPLWSGKKFRGRSSISQQVAEGSSGEPLSESALHSASYPTTDTSWDPPLEDGRKLPPGSTYINPILVDSPSPSHLGATPPASPLLHQASDSE